MDKQEYKNLAVMSANGDTEAFAKLYETVYREMYYTALYSLGSEPDAVEAVTGTVRDCFKSIGRLKTENAFRIFMMKTLCARIKAFQREYRNVGEPEPKSLLQRKLSALSDGDRVIAVMYIGAKFTADEIASFVGLSTGNVKKRLKSGLELLEVEK